VPVIVEDGKVTIGFAYVNVRDAGGSEKPENRLI
jgi:hypothetical protein